MSLILNSTSGGSVTINEPATASNFTLSLPAKTGTVMTEGTELLGTVATTSGTSQTLSGLDLTVYKTLKLFYNNVGAGSAAIAQQVNGQNVSTAMTGGNSHFGLVEIDLATGFFSSTLRQGSAGTGNITGTADNGASGKLGLTNATTSIVIGSNGSAFTRGSVNIYGVR